MSHAEAIQKNHDVLQRCTTINLYVIDFLGAKDVLDEAQESDLKAEGSHLRQRILLFRWLKVVPSDRYESFLQVMKEAEQEHVANLLTGSTEDDHLPLSDARYARLRKIRHKMAEVTHVDNEVIAELRRSKAISMTDAEELRAETVDYAKVSKLIGAIMRRSNHSYNSFQEVLRKTFQTAAADFFNEGEMPAVHLNNNRPDLDQPLSLAFNGVIRNTTTDDTDIKNLIADLNGLGLNLVKAIPGQSIVIFIYCKTVKSAVKFTQLFNSGRLQHILESILNRLLLTIEPSNRKKLNSRIKLEDKEVIILEEFTGIEDWMIESFKGQKLSGEIYRCNAATQTGGSRKKRKPRKRNKKKPNKYDPSSSAHADEGKRENLQGIQDTDRLSTDLEKPTSGAIIRSRAESQWESVSPGSSVISSATTQIADDESGVYGWSQRRRTEKKPEETKPSRRDLGSSEYVDKSMKGRLQEMKEYARSYSYERQTGWHDFSVQKSTYQLMPYFEEEMFPDFSTRNDDYFHLNRKLEETQKENEKLMKLLELQTQRAKNDDFFHLNQKLEEAQKENEKLIKLLELQTQRAKNDDYFQLKRKLEETQKENEKLVKLLEHQTQRGEFPDKYKSDPILVKTIRIEAAGEKNKSINGLTILDNELFVVSEESSEVEVYDSIKFSFSRRWTLKELSRPLDIGSCNINNCLYILDFKGDQSKDILRVDAIGKLLKIWSAGEDWVDCLSVTNESNVILAVSDKNKLNEYSADGQLIREINLSLVVGIHHPTHAIKMTNGHFLISHDIDDIQTVSAVDADGKLKKSFCEKCRSIVGQINCPVYLSIDGNGFVMVTDRENRRVLLLDSDLEFKREILSKERHGLRDPVMILLDETEGRLFVADNEWNEGQILIFKFK